MRARKTMAAALALAAMLPAGCDAGLGAADDSNTGTLRLQVSGEPEETAVYESVARAFEKQRRGVHVQMVSVAEKTDHLARLSTSFAAGNPPDVFLVNFREFAQFATRGALAPVGPMMSERGLDLADYFRAPVEAFTYRGALQCMPQNISSLVVYYNEELFRRAGVAEPPAEWGWAEFARTAKAMTRGQVAGLGVEPNVIRLAPFVWSNGGRLVDDLTAPSTFTLDQPRAREAVDFILSLVREHGVMPTEQQVAAQDLETRFETGKLAMLLSSRVDTPRFREVAGLEWDVAPLPVADEPANILHSDAYCLSAPSENQDLAADFIAFAAGRQGQTLSALGGRTVPSLKEVARSPAFLDPTQEPERAQVWLDAVPHLRRTPVWPTWTEIEDLSEELLTRAYYDDVAPAEVLRQLDAQTEPLFDQGRP
ncbi:MAG: ABC transporter substrate-binding protein [Nocardioidaceae bacterium]